MDNLAHKGELAEKDESLTQGADFEAFMASGAVLEPKIETPESDFLNFEEAEQGAEMEKGVEGVNESVVEKTETEVEKPKSAENKETRRAAKNETAAELAEMPMEYQEAKNISLPRDLKKLPGDYMAAVESGVDRALKQGRPDIAVKFMDELRWDAMEKTFGRKLGDGLNGKVA